jgi:transaldolase
MLAEAKPLLAVADNVTIKLPLTPEGLAACRALSDEGIRTNVTLCFSTTQAVLAAAAGATYVSPFIGRVDDTANDGIALLEEICDVFTQHDYATKVLAASLRHPQHVVQAALAGADVATLPAKVFHQMVRHPLTDRGLEQFLADWAGYGGTAKA